MAKPEIERRRSKRFSTESSVNVRTEGRAEQKCATRNISRGGVFFYSDSDIQQGSRIEVTMILPPDVTNGETLWVRCQATVVRVDKPAGGQYGIAAQVERLEFLPEQKA